jgi:hypothetical protein
MKICVYCGNEIKGYYCPTCNEYDGVVEMTEEEYKEWLEE